VDGSLVNSVVWGHCGFLFLAFVFVVRSGCATKKELETRKKDNPNSASHSQDHSGRVRGISVLNQKGKSGVTLKGHTSQVSKSVSVETTSMPAEDTAKDTSIINPLHNHS
jgi:hypothetical protein